MWRVGLKTSTDTMEGHHVERRIILKMNLEIRWESVDCISLDQNRRLITDSCLCGNGTYSVRNVCAICWIAKRLLCVKWRFCSVEGRSCSSRLLGSVSPLNLESGFHFWAAAAIVSCLRFTRNPFTPLTTPHNSAYLVRAERIILLEPRVNRFVTHGSGLLSSLFLSSGLWRRVVP